MPVDWNSDGVQMWKEKAVHDQQGYYNLFGSSKWREFKPSDYINLKREIGFAVFDYPEEEPDENLNDGTGYKKEQLKHINKIFGIIKKCMRKHTDQKNICVSFLYVFGKAEDVHMRFPVIRMPEHDITVKPNNDIFVDSSGRVYKNWQDYLQNNKLPDCVICYPKNGIYSALIGAVQVEFGITPAGKAGGKFLNGLDIGGTVLGVGASGIGIAALFVPVAWPVVAGATAATVLAGGYISGRNIQTLVDRKQHKQSIGLASAESRNCWLGIGGCLLSIASGGAVTAFAKAAEKGATVALAGQVAIKSLTVGSCVVNGLAVSNGLVHIIMKAVNGEQITTLDIFQFVSAVLFFTNSVISAHQAYCLIDIIAKNSTGQSSGETGISINQIPEFVIQTNLCNGIPQFVAWDASILLSNFSAVCKWVSRKMKEITVILKKGLITFYNYAAKVGQILQKFLESWNTEMAEVADKICKAFGFKSFSEMSGASLDHIRETAGVLIVKKRSLMNNEIIAVPSEQSQDFSDHDVFGDNVSHTNNRPKSLNDKEAETSPSSDDKEVETSLSFYDEMVNICNKFVSRQGCKNTADLVGYMAFICKFVERQFQKKKSDYEKTYEIAKDFRSVEEIQKMYGISGNPDSHFFQEVFKEFKSEEGNSFILLKMAYDSENASAREERGHCSFDTGSVRFIPFYNKCGLASNGMLSKEQYCEMAVELTGQHANKDSIYISACGDEAIMEVNAGAYVMAVQSLQEDGKISGIAVILRNSKE